MKRTARGFAIYTEFTDAYGRQVRVQKSSSAEHKRVWVFCEDTVGGVTRDRSPHLSPAMARRVAKALLRFAEKETT